MKKHTTHQTDEKAQRIFLDSLPSTWVANAQHNDYGKDYLVEVGAEDGELSGKSFYVQLKGQEKSSFTRDQNAVKFSLKKKHALYYADKVQDLPILLVVVDVGLKVARYLFLQPALLANSGWRERGSVSLQLPVGNVVDCSTLEREVLEAIRWMQLNSATSIADAIGFKRQQISQIDDRFDARITVNHDGQTETHLFPKEPVSINIQIKAVGADATSKLAEFTAGSLVAFETGQVTVSGSPLFNGLEDQAVSIGLFSERVATCELACSDESKKETGRLTEFPGRLITGISQETFHGTFFTSPLRIKIGPLSGNDKGQVALMMQFDCWNGRGISELPYFEKLHSFFGALTQSNETSILICDDGNSYFSTKVPLGTSSLVRHIHEYLTVIFKARRVAAHFSIDPIWSNQTFDPEEKDTIAQLYGILFENEWQEQRPDVVLNIWCDRKGFRSDLLKKADKPTRIQLISEPTFTMLGHKVEPGRMVMNLSGGSLMKKADKLSHKRGFRQKPKATTDVHIVFEGTKDTVYTMRLATETD